METSEGYWGRISSAWRKASPPGAANRTSITPCWGRIWSKFSSSARRAPPARAATSSCRTTSIPLIDSVIGRRAGSARSRRSENFRHQVLCDPPGRQDALHGMLPVPIMPTPRVVGGPGRQQNVAQVGPAGVSGFDDRLILAGIAKGTNLMGLDQDDTAQEGSSTNRVSSCQYEDNTSVPSAPRARSMSFSGQPLRACGEPIPAQFLGLGAGHPRQGRTSRHNSIGTEVGLKLVRDHRVEAPRPVVSHRIPLDSRKVPRPAAGRRMRGSSTAMWTLSPFRLNFQ